jgi:hypothetical protein
MYISLNSFCSLPIELHPGVQVPLDGGELRLPLSAGEEIGPPSEPHLCRLREPLAPGSGPKRVPRNCGQTLFRGTARKEGDDDGRHFRNSRRKGKLPQNARRPRQVIPLFSFLFEKMFVLYSLEENPLRKCRFVSKKIFMLSKIIFLSTRIFFLALKLKNFDVSKILI